MFRFLYFIAILGILNPNTVQAQEYNWSEDIAPIIFNNCVSCHRDGGIAPFTLTSYEDVAAGGMTLALLVDHGDMPPWPADPDYMHFANEAVLTDEEKAAVVWWVDNDMPIGDITLEPPLPTFPEPGSNLETIDLTIQIDPYTLQFDTDEYRWFAFENTSTEDLYLSKLEVIPGLESVVHHADIYYDLTGNSLIYDAADPLSGFNSSISGPAISTYINAWQPGGNIVEYPENWGIRIPAGADLLFEIHYGPGGIGETDDTKMNLQFVTNPEEVRPVYVSWYLNQSPSIFIDGPLVIPPNELSVFHQTRGPIPEDISLISICPHMHQLGRSYKVWYEGPDGIDYPLINIPHWDFHWQKYYTFQTVKHIPAGSIIRSEGVYDNTIDNHDNPFDPPQLVTGGPTTLDEMFLCYFIYTDYEEGDENIIMDPDLLVGVETLETDFDGEITIYPNPASNEILVELKNTKARQLQISVFNNRSQLVHQETIHPAELEITRINITDLESGLYHLQISDGESSRVLEFVKE